MGKLTPIHNQNNRTVFSDQLSRWTASELPSSAVTTGDLLITSNTEAQWSSSFPTVGHPEPYEFDPPLGGASEWDIGPSWWGWGRTPVVVYTGGQYVLAGIYRLYIDSTYKSYLGFWRSTILGDPLLSYTVHNWELIGEYEVTSIFSMSKNSIYFLGADANDNHAFFTLDFNPPESRYIYKVDSNPWQVTEWKGPDTYSLLSTNLTHVYCWKSNNTVVSISISTGNETTVISDVNASVDDEPASMNIPVTLLAQEDGSVWVVGQTYSTGDPYNWGEKYNGVLYLTKFNSSGTAVKRLEMPGFAFLGTKVNELGTFTAFPIPVAHTNLYCDYDHFYLFGYAFISPWMWHYESKPIIYEIDGNTLEVLQLHIPPWPKISFHNDATIPPYWSSTDHVKHPLAGAWGKPTIFFHGGTNIVSNYYWDDLYFVQGGIPPCAQQMTGWCVGKVGTGPPVQFY